LLGRSQEGKRARPQGNSTTGTAKKTARGGALGVRATGENEEKKGEVLDKEGSSQDEEEIKGKTEATPRKGHKDE